MKVAVTGATGFLGSALVDKLLELNYEVTAIGRTAAALTSDCKFHKIAGINGDTDYTGALEGVDCVVHCAAHVHQTEPGADTSMKTFMEVNYSGTVNLVKQAIKAGVRRFVFISSIKVFGEEHSPGESYCLDSELKPVDPYGISKQAAEKALMEECSGSSMEWVVVRPPLIYGANVKANFLALIKLLQKRIPLPFASVQNQRSIIYLGNMVHFVELCINKPEAANRVFLVSDGEDVSTSRLITCLASGLGVKVHLFWFSHTLLRLMLTVIGKQGLAKRLLGSLRMDISESKSIMSWQPPYDQEEALHLTARQYRLE